MGKFDNMASALIGVRAKRNGANEKLAFVHDAAGRVGAANCGGYVTIKNTGGSSIE